MLLSRNIVETALNNIMSQPNFGECMKLARDATKGGKLYLVGGKLYRSLIEAIYGWDAKANRCDFDFATTSFQATELKDGWRLNELKGKEPYIDENGNKKSTHFINEAYGAELDIIYIPTILQVRNGELPNTILGYFASVPLDIQAIALDVDTAELMGTPGQESIINKMVNLNNAHSLKEYCLFKGIDEHSYIKRKAESLGFDYKWTRPKARTIYSDAWMDNTIFGLPTSISTVATVAPVQPLPLPWIPLT